MGLGQASPHRCLLAADKASDKEKEKRRGLLLSEVGCVTRPDEEEDEGGMRNGQTTIAEVHRPRPTTTRRRLRKVASWSQPS